MKKLIFEDRALDGAIRLVSVEDAPEIEIGLHYAAPEGDFIIYEPDSATILPTFDDIIHHITQKYGENNLHEFREKAMRVQAEMYNDKYVRMWKRRKKPLKGGEL